MCLAEANVCTLNDSIRPKPEWNDFKIVYACVCVCMDACVCGGGGVGVGRTQTETFNALFINVLLQQIVR